MKFDKKLITVFAITTLVAAGTAFASLRTITTTTESINLGSNPSISATTTTTTYDSKSSKPVVTVTTTESNFALILGRLLGITIAEERIVLLRNNNLGYGDIAFAYNLAHASGRSVDDILDMRYHQKMGWGKIAKTLGVKMNGSVDNTIYVLHEARLDNEANDFKVNIQIDLDDNLDEPKDKAKEKSQQNDEDDKHDHKKQDNNTKNNDHGNNGENSKKHK